MSAICAGSVYTSVIRRDSPRIDGLDYEGYIRSFVATLCYCLQSDARSIPHSSSLISSGILVQRGNIVPILLHVLRPALTFFLAMISNTRVNPQYTSKRPMSSSVTVSVISDIFCPALCWPCYRRSFSMTSGRSIYTFSPLRCYWPR